MIDLWPAITLWLSQVNPLALMYPRFYSWILNASNLNCTQHLSIFPLFIYLKFLCKALAKSHPRLKMPINGSSTACWETVEDLVHASLDWVLKLKERLDLCTSNLGRYCLKQQQKTSRHHSAQTSGKDFWGIKPFTTHEETREKTDTGLDSQLWKNNYVNRYDSRCFNFISLLINVLEGSREEEKVPIITPLTQCIS